MCIRDRVHGINFQSKFGGIAKIFVLWFNADTSKTTGQELSLIHIFAPDKTWNFDFLARLCHGGTIKGACV